MRLQISPQQKFRLHIFESHYRSIYNRLVTVTLTLFRSILVIDRKQRGKHHHNRLFRNHYKLMVAYIPCITVIIDQKQFSETSKGYKRTFLHRFCMIKMVRFNQNSRGIVLKRFWSNHILEFSLATWALNCNWQFAM